MNVKSNFVTLQRPISQKLFNIDYKSWAMLIKKMAKSLGGFAQEK